MIRGGEQVALAVHGIVLAGGKSSRMGRDKAMICFRGLSLVEIAIGTLRGFCAGVSIAGNREDLSRFAPVIREEMLDVGPAAGLQAGLDAATQPWALFLPVDVPLIPADLLRSWAQAVLAREREGVCLSYLRADHEPQPAICLLRKACLPALTMALGEGTYKLLDIFDVVASALGASSLWAPDAEDFGGTVASGNLQASFCNVNRPEDLVGLEVWAARRTMTVSGPGGEGHSHG